MLNSQSVLRNDVTLYCLPRYVCFESSFVFFFIILAPDLDYCLDALNKMGLQVKTLTTLASRTSACVMFACKGCIICLKVYRKQLKQWLKK